MHTFFCPGIANGIRELDKDESAHAARVLRMSSGDTIMILDGKGLIAEALLETVSASKCTFNVIAENQFQPLRYRIHIAIAPTKMNDRMEWFLEKAVELGIESVTPVICDRSERRVVNHDRFEKVIRSAVKQSMQPYMTALNPSVSFRNFIEQSQPGYIAHCNSGDKKEFSVQPPIEGCVTILIGPEGDFSPAEVAAAAEKGWNPVSLGASRLRTETSGVYVCSVIRMHNETSNSH